MSSRAGLDVMVLPLLGIESEYIGRPVRSIAAIPTEYKNSEKVSMFPPPSQVI
jgi:hypothetical protein